jgi:thymidylate synthase (FAD)
MKVKLMTHTPNPEAVIASAARLCYSSATIDDLMKKSEDDESTRKYIDMLMSLGHESPIEHVSFTFGIEGISRACSHQLVRHRIASYSQKSQRYVNETQFEYVTPEAIASNPIIKAVYDETMQLLQDRYDSIRAALVQKYIKSGIDVKAAGKKANEDARMILPNATCTSIIVTMNIRSLFNFFKHRCCNRAQWEIRAVAMEMWNQCMSVAPNIFKYAGPDCVTKGKCSEGKMTCGHPVNMIYEVEERYKDIATPGID